MGITYMTEYLPDNQRGFYIIGLDIFKTIGGLVATGAAWMSNEDWRTFVLSPVPFFVIALMTIVLFLPESSRYLLYRHNVEKLEENLNEM